MIKQKKYTKRQLQEIEEDLRAMKRATAILKDSERLAHVKRLLAMKREVEIFNYV